MDQDQDKKRAEEDAQAAPEAEAEAQAAPEAPAEHEAPAEDEAPAEAAEEEEAPAEAAEEEEAEAEDAEEEEAEADPLAEAAAEIAELKDRLLRAMADTENTRRRAERDREDASKYAIAGFARDLLAVKDNLERALASVEEGARAEDQALDSLMSGVELTARELKSAFDRHGITEISALGQRFDHNRHQAVVELEDQSQPPGTVVHVMQVGYMIKDRLLRPAMVGVAKGAAPAPDEPAEESDGGVDTIV